MLTDWLDDWYQQLYRSTKHQIISDIFSPKRIAAHDFPESAILAILHGESVWKFNSAGLSRGGEFIRPSNVGHLHISLAALQSSGVTALYGALQNNESDSLYTRTAWRTSTDLMCLSGAFRSFKRPLRPRFRSAQTVRPNRAPGRILRVALPPVRMSRICAMLSRVPSRPAPRRQMSRMGFQGKVEST